MGHRLCAPKSLLGGPAGGTPLPRGQEAKGLALQGQHSPGLSSKEPSLTVNLKGRLRDQPSLAWFWEQLNRERLCLGHPRPRGFWGLGPCPLWKPCGWDRCQDVIFLPCLLPAWPWDCTGGSHQTLPFHLPNRTLIIQSEPRARLKFLTPPTHSSQLGFAV